MYLKLREYQCDNRRSLIFSKKYFPFDTEKKNVLMEPSIKMAQLVSENWKFSNLKVNLQMYPFSQLGMASRRKA